MKKLMLALILTVMSVNVASAKGGSAVAHATVPSLVMVDGSSKNHPTEISQTRKKSIISFVPFLSFLTIFGYVATRSK